MQLKIPGPPCPPRWVVRTILVLLSIGLVADSVYALALLVSLEKYLGNGKGFFHQDADLRWLMLRLAVFSAGLVFMALFMAAITFRMSFWWKANKKEELPQMGTDGHR